jgi:hypothetical protein
MLEVEAQLLGASSLQAAEAFTQKHRGTAAIAALKVQMGHGELEDALKHSAAGALGFMPELLETVVAGIPRTGIKKPDGLPEAGIGHQAGFLGWRLAHALKE